MLMDIRRHNRFFAPTFALILIAAFSLSIFAPFAFAQSPSMSTGQFVSRGQAVEKIVDSFNLYEAQKDFIDNCLEHKEECFMTFGAMSHFDGMAFSPLRLYPDVSIAHPHSKAINTATMLGLTWGFSNEKNSPFRPQRAMTRIQALKVILSATEQINWKEKFELTAVEATPFRDIDGSTKEMWWYPRYVNFALSKGIIVQQETFRPDEPISEEELNLMIQRAKKLPLNGVTDADSGGSTNRLVRPVESPLNDSAQLYDQKNIPPNSSGF